NTRANLLRNIIGFLAPGVNGIGTIALNSPAYTIPSMVTVEVADSDLTGAGSLDVTAYSDTESSGQTITLQETVRPGLFRGFIPLIPHTEPHTSGSLRVESGDMIWIEYLDASSGSIVRAAAEVD